MRIKPWELYELDLVILGEMIVACMRAEEEAFDMQMQITAWQSALLMNSTGNFKKKIKPEDLYTPLADFVEKEKKKQEGFNPEDKQKLQEELLKSFGGSDVIIQ